MNFPKFPIAIDNTMRDAFVDCPQRFFKTHIQHWKETPLSIHLRAGGAFAKGLERGRRSFWELNNTPQDATYHAQVELLRTYETMSDLDKRSPKSLDNMMLALASYFEHYGFGTDHIKPLALPSGKYAIEFTFALPIPGVRHPITNDPLLYCGRADQIGVFQDTLWVCDDKTTTQLGEHWSDQWKLNSQLTGYVWAARTFGYDVAGAIVRGVSIQKSGAKHAEVVERRPDWFVEQWLEQLYHDANRMITCFMENRFDYAFGHACSNYGGCPFLEVCGSRHPDRWLEANFIKHEWNPLKTLSIVKDEP